MYGDFEDLEAGERNGENQLEIDEGSNASEGEDSETSANGEGTSRAPGWCAFYLLCPMRYLNVFYNRRKWRVNSRGRQARQG